MATVAHSEDHYQLPPSARSKKRARFLRASTKQGNHSHGLNIKENMALGIHAYYREGSPLDKFIADQTKYQCDNDPITTLWVQAARQTLQAKAKRNDPIDGERDFVRFDMSLFITDDENHRLNWPTVCRPGWSDHSGGTLQHVGHPSLCIACHNGKKITELREIINILKHFIQEYQPDYESKLEPFMTKCFPEFKRDLTAFSEFMKLSDKRSESSYQLPQAQPTSGQIVQEQSLPESNDLSLKRPYRGDERGDFDLPGKRSRIRGATQEKTVASSLNRLKGPADDKEGRVTACRGGGRGDQGRAGPYKETLTPIQPSSTAQSAGNLQIEQLQSSLKSQEGSLPPDALGKTLDTSLLSLSLSDDAPAVDPSLLFLPLSDDALAVEPSAGIDQSQPNVPGHSSLPHSSPMVEAEVGRPTDDNEGADIHHFLNAITNWGEYDLRDNIHDMP
ncbi:hypothetical protein F5Y16DRAFT_393710 [Xylariaceae sp. FL0255]|nr:hypothetical protein F5Y16DRAFT_393710 [Xylariaceae sp. FL0255]